MPLPWPTAEMLADIVAVLIGAPPTLIGRAFLPIRFDPQFPLGVAIPLAIEAAIDPDDDAAPVPPARPFGEDVPSHPGPAQAIDLIPGSARPIKPIG